MYSDVLWLANIGWRLLVNRCKGELSANRNCCDVCRGVVWNYCCGEDVTTDVSRVVCNPVTNYRTRQERLKVNLVFEKEM